MIKIKGMIFKQVTNFEAWHTSHITSYWKILEDIDFTSKNMFIDCIKCTKSGKEFKMKSRLEKRIILQLLEEGYYFSNYVNYYYCEFNSKKIQINYLKAKIKQCTEKLILLEKNAEK